MIRTTSILALAIAVTSSPARSADRDTSWVAKDISVVQTVPGQDGTVNTRLEVGTGGDARITIDVRGPGNRIKGTIVLVAGRWMLTQGFTPTPGAEIDTMDIAALNSQLVMKLLEAGLPKGPPVPRSPAHITASERKKPIEVATSSASGSYGPPWNIDGTVAVQTPGAPATYRIVFTFSNEGRTTTMNLAGSVGVAMLSLSDSTPLNGWAVHKIGPYQQQSSDGTTLDYGARPQAPKAVTLGDLRKLK